jgi:hypothetical protein
LRLLEDLKSQDGQLSQHKIHIHYLYQIIHLPVKENILQYAYPDKDQKVQGDMAYYALVR